MNTLWTFGDSYAECYTQDHNNEQYLNHIAKTLNYKHESHGLSGTSISYSRYHFNNVRNDIDDNDMVIIVLTNLFRHWFVKDKPTEAGLLRSLYKEEKKAIKQYMTYLYNDLEHITTVYDFLYNVEYLTMQKQLKTLIIYAFHDIEHIVKNKEHDFEHLKFANGTLEDIQRNEFKAGIYKEWVNTPYEKIGDPRLNHMLKRNHYILTDKIIKHFQQGTTIDLTVGFDADIIDHNCRGDQAFENECFGNKYNMFGVQ